MKIRNGFVSNSSSSSFVITNISKNKKTLVDFVIENRQLLDSYNNQYSGHYTLGQLIDCADNENIEFKPGSSKICIFGDEQDTAIGCVYDYILRDGGKSKSFKWKFKEALR